MLWLGNALVPGFLGSEQTLCSLLEGFSIDNFAAAFSSFTARIFALAGEGSSRAVGVLHRLIYVCLQRWSLLCDRWAFDLHFVCLQGSQNVQWYGVGCVWVAQPGFICSFCTPPALSPALKGLRAYTGAIGHAFPPIEFQKFHCFGTCPRT